MLALVTGPGGFLGRYIVEQLLARGDRVRGFARGSYPELEQQGVEMLQGDLVDREAVHAACQGVDCVFHVAGKVGVWGHWFDFFRANIHGTLNIIACCHEQNVPRLVFTSSPSVTFDGSDQQGVDESVPYPRRWMAHYPHSKAMAEQFVLTANSDGLRTCALRPHLIWGPRDHHLTARLIARARSGRLRRVGRGENMVDMIYVENAAEAHLMAADALSHELSPVAGKAYFLSQGEPVACWPWIDQILALVGHPPVDKAISRWSAYQLGRLFEIVWWATRNFKTEPPMTRFVAQQLATHHWFDISAAQRDFGYKPSISTAEGMQRLGVWLRENLPDSVDSGS